MSFRYAFLSLALISGWILSQCDSTLPTNRFGKADAEEIATRLVPGSTIAYTYDSTYRDTTLAWYIGVTPPNGGAVTVVLHKHTGELLSIFGNTPPFNYEVEPGLLLLPFSITRDTALHLRPGELQRWLLQRPPLIPRWEYDFFIAAPDSLRPDTTSLWFVAIDAETGFPITMTLLP